MSGEGKLNAQKKIMAQRRQTGGGKERRQSAGYLFRSVSACRASGREKKRGVKIRGRTIMPGPLPRLVIIVVLELTMLPTVKVRGPTNYEARRLAVAR
ncbi:hypothetical protein KM043_013536 [Ampulex compressa]|nr:hypothetical protein KM043_013536 [Ampulex compressa]